MGVNAVQHFINQAPFRSTFQHFILVIFDFWLLFNLWFYINLFCACSLIQQGNWKKRKRNVHLNGTWCKTFGVLLQWRKNVSQIFHLVYLKRSDSLKSLLRFNSLQKVVVCNENFIEIYFSTKKLIFHFFQKSSQISTNDF